jgi:integrase
MAKSISVVFLKQVSSDKVGTLYIRTIEDRITRKKSLGIHLKESEFNKFFDPKKQLFKSDSRFDFEEKNFIIKNKLKELTKHDENLSYLPDEKKSFTKYWQKYINTIENYGTKIKHEVIFAKLKKFLTSINKTGLLFIEITPSLIRELKLYLTKVKDPKVLSSNTVNHYLKVIKSVINKARKEDEYIYSKDPFATIDFKKSKIVKNVLSPDDITKLLKNYMWHPDLWTIRDMFVFQVFSNGMRVSDLMLLRWNCFKNHRLEYRMFKTNYPISIPLNVNTGTILHEILHSTNSYNQLMASHELDILNSDGNVVSLNLKDIEEQLRPMAAHELTLNNDKRDKFNSLLITKKLIKYKGYYFKEKNEAQVIRLVDAKEVLLKRVDEFYIQEVFNQIAALKKRQLNDFVFPFLDNEAFKDIDSNNDFSKMSIKQYKLLKHATIVYNRKLKILQKETDVQVPLSSHVARHTFTNLLLLMEDVNLYDISQSLGHASLSITQNYIQSGFNTNKVDYINTTMSEKFKRT